MYKKEKVEWRMTEITLSGSFLNGDEVRTVTRKKLMK